MIDHAALAPVHPAAGDPVGDADGLDSEWGSPDAPAPDHPQPGIALCLSGGGYRAMLFHVGALWRLNTLGYLPKLARVSSVSGGSIAAGVLALAWPRLAFDAQGVGRQFEREVVGPLRALAGRTLDAPAAIRGLVRPGWAAAHIAQSYRQYLFDRHTLQDLPADEDGPRFVINATNVQSGALWRFSRPFMADYRVGLIRGPRIELAVAVAASSAYPPYLSPLILPLAAGDYVPGSGLDLQTPPYTTRVMLTDGGIYDNLGLETAWKRYQTILVSDGGRIMPPVARPHSDWLRGPSRIHSLQGSQVTSLRKRQLLASYGLPAGTPGYRIGAYWGIYTDITRYGLAGALCCPPAQTLALANLPTRLAALPAPVQGRLINWGFAVCDAAMRRHMDPALPAPVVWPYPDGGVG